jgi:hypothetical protein
MKSALRFLKSRSLIEQIVATLVAAAILGVVGATYACVSGDDDPPNSTSSGTTTHQGSTPQSSSTSTTTSRSAPQPADRYPVTLRVTGPDDSLNVTSTWTVNGDPLPGRVRFLIAEVEQHPSNGSSYVDHFPKAELGGHGSEPASVTFSLRAADPHSSRKVGVVSVSEQCAETLRQAIRQDVPAGSACAGERWNFESNDFVVLKP